MTLIFSSNGRFQRFSFKRFSFSNHMVIGGFFLLRYSMKFIPFIYKSIDATIFASWDVPSTYFSGRKHSTIISINGAGLTVLGWIKIRAHSGYIWIGLQSKMMELEPCCIHCHISMSRSESSIPCCFGTRRNSGFAQIFHITYIQYTYVHIYNMNHMSITFLWYL